MYFFNYDYIQFSEAQSSIPPEKLVRYDRTFAGYGCQAQLTSHLWGKNRR